MRAVIWLALLALGWVLIICGIAGNFGSFLACFVAPSAVDEQGVIEQEAQVPTIQNPAPGGVPTIPIQPIPGGPTIPLPLGSTV
jgi:hypothetical protein